MFTGDKVKHTNRKYGVGTIKNMVGHYAFVDWGNDGLSMESIQNLEKVEE